ncbi:MAG: PQQ-binding-like beta-propeller repeat protein [Bryobacteraceae bacterium]
MRVPFISLLFVTSLFGSDWHQFRGPNSSGIGDSKGLPVEFGPDKNVIWKTSLPPGHSSPVFTKDRIFLTAIDSGKLFTFCLDRATGRIQWRREVPRPREQELHKSNHPASPSPVTDGRNVYVFFGDYGLVSFGPDGNERWKLPLGPFNNPMGMGSSPVLAGNTLLQVCDQESGSFFIALDKDTGKTKWRVERPEVTRGFSTPLLYQQKDGPQEVLVTGAYQMTSYAVETGKPVWWLRGLTWQLKPTPVLSEDKMYIQGWAGGADDGQQEEVMPFEEALRRFDANKDGKIVKAEITDEKLLKDWLNLDLDKDNEVNERDWRFFRSRRLAQNGILAFKLGGEGDMTEKNFLWRYTKSLPNVPSPLLYDGVLYMLKEGGILTSFDPDTGKVLKQARLQGALGQYFSSPVAADGKIYTVSEEGKASVLKPGGEWEILAVHDLGEECHATPAILDNRIYLRTKNTLYCFGK